MFDIVTIQSPASGWNSTAPRNKLAPDEAIILDNLISDTGVLNPRLGSTLYSDLTGSISKIGGLYEFQAAMVNKFLASGDGLFLDITDPDNPVELGNNFTNDYWASTVFGGTAQSVIAFVNGADDPVYYDGSTPNMKNLNLIGNGLDPKNLIDIFNFKNRVWFVEKNSQNAWYSPLNALIGGQTLTKFYVGNLTSFGGNLVTIKSFTADGGSGRQEFLAFYMSTGEIIIYQGDDPAEATTFTLVGIYKSGRPINSPRAVCKFGSDLVALTDSGYFPISTLLPYSFGKSNDPLTEKIRGAALQAVNSNFTAPNWQIILVQNLGLLLVNVPTTQTGIINQHVLNVNTMAWSSFSNIISNVWCVFGNNLYFGDINGKVWEYSGSKDYADLTNGNSGDEITCTYVSSYLFSGIKGQIQSTAFRPRLLIQGGLTLTISASPDFKTYSTPYSIVMEDSGLQWGASANNPAYSPGPATLPPNPDQGYFGDNDPGLIPPSSDPIPWGRSPVLGGIYSPGPSVLPFPPGSPQNAPYFGEDDPGASPSGEIAWSTDIASSLGFLNLNYIFYSISIKLVFVSSLPFNYYETDFLLKKSYRI